MSQERFDLFNGKEAKPLLKKKESYIKPALIGFILGIFISYCFFMR